jgi:hypothetical protein
MANENEIARLRAMCDAGEISEFELGKRLKALADSGTSTAIAPFIGRPLGTYIGAGISAVLAILCTLPAMGGAASAGVFAGFFWMLAISLLFWGALIMLFHKIELRLIEIQKATKPARD